MDEVVECRAAMEDMEGIDLAKVSHVVVHVSADSKEKIWKSIDYRTRWRRPWLWWTVIGKSMSNALWGNPSELLLLTEFRTQDRESVGFTTASWAAATKAAKEANVTPPAHEVIEVNLNSLQPDQPLEVSGQKAEDDMVRLVQQWLRIPEMDISRALE